MEPVIKALYDRYHEQVQFIVVDVQTLQGAQMAAQFQVSGVPTMFFIDSQGNVQDMILGGASKDFIEEKIKALID